MVKGEIRRGGVKNFLKKYTRGGANKRTFDKVFGGRVEEIDIEFAFDGL